MINIKNILKAVKACVRLLGRLLVTLLYPAVLVHAGLCGILWIYYWARNDTLAKEFFAKSMLDLLLFPFLVWRKDWV